MFPFLKPFARQQKNQGNPGVNQKGNPQRQKYKTKKGLTQG
jgi:hypothetical protein